MKKLFWMLIASVLVLPLVTLEAQDPENETTGEKKQEQVKTGWTFGGVPVVAYDADVGFKYGALVNLYNFGDGSRYPMYDQSIYVEWSRTTKGSGINQITWDTDKLIPGIRSFFEASLLTEQALDFYGFNGYQAKFTSGYELDPQDDLSDRLFYRHSRQLIRVKADFQGEIIGQKFRWLGGVGFYGNNIGAVDVATLNEGKTEDLLSTNSLYNNYVDWGIIKDDQKNGGGHTLLKGGLIYDTRDNEPNPFSGIWTEMQIHYAPSLLSNTDYGYGRFIFTHRQYFTIIPEWVNFAGRVSYQGKIFGEMPFYMMPYLFNTAPKLTTDGVGGSKTVRGVMRNRIVGEGFAYSNLELRGKILKTRFLKQNFYIALSGFVDAGMVTQKYKLPADLLTTFPEAATHIDPNAKEIPHVGYGGGIHFVLNQNFIVTVDYGLAAKADDGNSGMYINLNFLY
ncbi:MAG: BamA/TamA family outer membrane protein [Bacteroidales bacterium]